MEEAATREIVVHRPRPALNSGIRRFWDTAFAFAPPVPGEDSAVISALPRLNRNCARIRGVVSQPAIQSRRSQPRWVVGHKRFFTHLDAVIACFSVGDHLAHVPGRNEETFDYLVDADA